MPHILKRKHTLIFTALILGLLYLNLFSQSAAGTWIDSNYKIKMILNNNYTYYLEHTNGKSQGQWRSQNNQFCLYDSSGAQPVCYTIITYQNNKLSLKAPNGMILNFIKNNSINKKKHTFNQTIISQKNNFILREGHFRHAINLIQFIIGGKIKNSEIKELKQALLKEFQTSQQIVIKELTNIGNSMQRVYQSTDAIIIGRVRQELFSAFHKATRQMTETQKPLLIRVIHRYITVLAFDEKNNLILTNRDIDGYINYVFFNNQLSGNNIQLSKSVKDSIRKNLITKFSSMPVNQKQILASSSLIWELMNGNWQRLSPAQKEQYKRAYQTRVSSQFKNRNPVNPQTAWNNYSKRNNQNNTNISKKPGSKKSLLEMQRDFNAKQNMYRMMSNMNTQSHVTSLNIIENMGGSPNYWKVVDY